MEGIKEAIAYIAKLAVEAEKPEQIEINGRTYCTKSLNRYDRPDMAEPIKATTLTSLVDYIKESREEQHESVPKLSTVLDKHVDEKYYIDDEKAQTIIAQALEKLESLGKVHATLTPDRVDKRQNGPRAKEDEAEMFILTAQDIHGVIVCEEELADTVQGICEETGLLNPDGCGKTLRVGGGGR